MASTPQTCPDCDCSDTPLSVVANVLSILTFALGVAASIAAFTAVTRGATREIEETRNVLRMVGQQIAQTRRFLKTLQNRTDPDLEMMRGLIGDSLEAFVAAEREMQSDLREFRMENTGRELPHLSFLSRLKWWYYEKGVRAGVVKLREFQQQFAAVQLIFIESKIKRQSDDISDLLYRAEHPD